MAEPTTPWHLSCRLGKPFRLVVRGRNIGLDLDLHYANRIARYDSTVHNSCHGAWLERDVDTTLIDFRELNARNLMIAKTAECWRSPEHRSLLGINERRVLNGTYDPNRDSLITVVLNGAATYGIDPDFQDVVGVFNKRLRGIGHPNGTLGRAIPVPDQDKINVFRTRDPNGSPGANENQELRERRAHPASLPTKRILVRNENNDDTEHVLMAKPLAMYETTGDYCSLEQFLSGKAVQALSPSHFGLLDVYRYSHPLADSGYSSHTNKLRLQSIKNYDKSSAMTCH